MINVYLINTSRLVLCTICKIIIQDQINTQTWQLTSTTLQRRVWNGTFLTEARPSSINKDYFFLETHVLFQTTKEITFISAQ